MAEPGIVFWILAVVTVASAVMVVTLKNIFHCALALILCLFSVAGIYILLNAEFLAAAQVLIYVGAVAILMIFAIMLTSNLASKAIRQSNEQVMVGTVVSVLFCGGMLALIYLTDKAIVSEETGVAFWRQVRGTLPADNVASLGGYLMTKFMLPFEVVSVLLLAAMIGAIVLARKEKA
ncbi:MAG: NADH-quinone oxidoreductase subunit J [Candidatus Zixiibacteriota bacterium]|nr:MAG: NADH-quinone oxidoreductase subunit J [candidate division Zixibacteria bacterium]